MQRKPDGGLKKSKSAQFAKPLNGERGAVHRPILLALAFALFLTGCAGYQLGPTNGIPAGSRSIQIKLFRNETWEPRLSAPIAFALREWIQRDGTYRLATGGDADIVVDGVITEFNRSGISFEPSDVLTVRDYEVSAVVKFAAVEAVTGKVLVESTVLGRTTIRSGPDLSSAERQAAPLIAEDVARRITSLLVDGTW